MNKAEIAELEFWIRQRQTNVLRRDSNLHRIYLETAIEYLRELLIDRERFLGYIENLLPPGGSDIRWELWQDDPERWKVD